MYSLDHDKLQLQNTPVILQKPVFLALSSVLNTANRRIYTEFISWKTAQDLRLDHNGTVESLEAILNHFFPVDSEVQIEIIDVEPPEDTYIADVDAVLQTYFGDSTTTAQTYLGCAPIYFGIYDFIVRCDDSLEAQDLLIRQVVNDYKIAGKIFEIQYI